MIVGVVLEGKTLVKPYRVKRVRGRPVAFYFRAKGRELVVMRPTQFGKHQLPRPDVPGFIGNYWIIEEYTEGRHVSGQGAWTVWYWDLKTALGVLKRILEEDLDVPRKDKPETMKILEEFKGRWD